MKIRHFLHKTKKIYNKVNPLWYADNLRKKYLPTRKIKGAIMKGISGSKFSYSNSASGGYTPRTIAQLTTR